MKNKTIFPSFHSLVLQIMVHQCLGPWWRHWQNQVLLQPLLYCTMQISRVLKRTKFTLSSFAVQLDTYWFIALQQRDRESSPLVTWCDNFYQIPEQIRHPRYTCSCRRGFVTFDDSDNETLIQPCRLLWELMFMYPLNSSGKFLIDVMMFHQQH